MPCPSLGWAQIVYPDLPDDEALARLWTEVAHVCRLDVADPLAAWNERLDRLVSAAAQARRASAGLAAFRRAREPTWRLGCWRPRAGGRLGCARLKGSPTRPTCPPRRCSRAPTPSASTASSPATKPLYTSGQLITGLRVRFEAGRAVAIEAEQGAETLRALSRPRRRAQRAWARSRSSTARAASEPWARSSTRPCWTRTRPATSRSGRALTLRCPTRPSRHA